MIKLLCVLLITVITLLFIWALNWLYFYTSCWRKTNSTNNHKDKNLRQRNTNWAACLLSKYSIFRGSLMNNMYLMLQATNYNMCHMWSDCWNPSDMRWLQEWNNKLSFLFICRLHNPCIDHMKVKQEWSPDQLLMGFICH